MLLQFETAIHDELIPTEQISKDNDMNNSSFSNTTLMFSQGGFSASGGGFMQSPTSQTSTSSRTLVPLSSYIISNSTYSDKDGTHFIYKDLSFTQVVIIGLIRSVDFKVSSISYTIDDMSGPLIEVKYWLDDTSIQEQFKENEYIRVCGVVKQFQGQHSIVAFHISRVTSVNQITVHLLEIAVAIKHSITEKNKISNTIAPHNTSMMDTSADIAMNGGLTGLELQITKFLKNCQSDCGASLEDIIENFRNFSDARIRKAIDFLSSEGHIFTTVDENHFCYTGLC
ncbi:hypothetical protein GJ496_001740 [Pomphorhynchus laevis]|nr:hypothetical protein GJ496_001740 [Pomphorhynchus laevis]